MFEQLHVFFFVVFLFFSINKVKVKVSHSLIAVGQWGLESHCILGTADKGGAHPSPFAALSFPNSKKVPIFCWVDRESFPVAAWRSRASNSRDTATFYTIAELL